MITQFSAGFKRQYQKLSDIHFTYLVEANEIWLLSVGSHDKGLDKK